MKKKTIKTITWIVLAGSIASIGAAALASRAYALDFSDVYDTRYYKAVDELSDYGIVNGINALQFAGDRKVQRQEMALFISRAITGATDGNFGSAIHNFKDITDKTYETAIAYCNINGIINGTSNNMFNPTGYITYQDALVMACRACGMTGSIKFNYPDDYIAYAESNGLTAGITGVNYTDEINRYVAVQIIYNMLYSKSYKSTDIKIPQSDGTYKSSYVSGGSTILNTDFGLIEGRYIITANDEMSINGKVASSGNVILSRIWDSGDYINGTFDEQNEISYDLLNIDAEYDMCIGTQVELKVKDDYTEVFECNMLSTYDVYTSKSNDVRVNNSGLTIGGRTYTPVKYYTKWRTGDKNKTDNEIIVYDGNRAGVELDLADIYDIIKSGVDYEIILINDNTNKTHRAVIKTYELGCYSLSGNTIYIGKTKIGATDDVTVRSNYKLYSGDYVYYSYDSKNDVLTIKDRLEVINGKVTAVTPDSIFIGDTEYKIADNREALIGEYKLNVIKNIEYSFIVDGKKIIAITSEVDTLDMKTQSSQNTEDNTYGNNVTSIASLNNDGYVIPVLDVDIELLQILNLKDKIVERIAEYCESENWSNIAYILRYMSKYDDFDEYYKYFGLYDDIYDEDTLIDWLIAKLISSFNTITSEMLQDNGSNWWYYNNIAEVVEEIIDTAGSGSIGKVGSADSDVKLALYSLMDPDGILGDISASNSAWIDYIAALNEANSANIDYSNCAEVIFGYFNGEPAVIGVQTIKNSNDYYSRYRVNNGELYRYSRNTDDTVNVYRITDDYDGVYEENNKMYVYSNVNGNIYRSETYAEYSRFILDVKDTNYVIKMYDNGGLEFNMDNMTLESADGNRMENTYYVTDNTTLYINQNGKVQSFNGSQITSMVDTKNDRLDVTMIFDDTGRAIRCMYIQCDIGNLVYENVTNVADDSDNVFITSFISSSAGSGYIYRGMLFEGSSPIEEVYVHSDSKINVGLAYSVNESASSGNVYEAGYRVNYEQATVLSVNSNYIVAEYNGEVISIPKNKYMRAYVMNYSNAASGDSMFYEIDASQIQYGAVITFFTTDLDNYEIDSLIVISLS